MNNEKHTGKFVHEMSDEERQKWKKALQELREEIRRNKND